MSPETPDIMDAAAMFDILEGASPEPEPEPDDEPVADDQPVAGEEEPVSGEPADDDEPDEGDGGEPEPEEGEKPKTYKIQGKEYSLDEILQSGLLDNLVTQANQVSHYQNLYHQAKQALEAFQAHLMQQQQAARPMITPEQVRAQLLTDINQVVQEGWFEPEYAEAFPRATTSMMMVYKDYLQTKAMVAQIYNYLAQDLHQRTYRDTRANFDATCNRLAKVHEIYKGLGDSKTREDFFKFLVEKVNPETSAINEEFLARQYLAFQQDNLLKLINPANRQSKPAVNKKRRFAAGEGSPAPRAKSQGGRQLTPDEQIMLSLLQD